MASYSTNEFRSGLKVMLDGEPCSILENEFVKPGKGQAFNRVRLRNLKTGRVWERTFKSGEKLEAADVMDRTMEYLYTDGEFWYFMEPDTFEQHQADANAVGESKQWLKVGGAPEFCRTRNCRNRPRAEGRHCAGRQQARHAQHRRRGQGAAVPQPGRGSPGGHPYR